MVIYVFAWLVRHAGAAKTGSGMLERVLMHKLLHFVYCTRSCRLSTSRVTTISNG